MPVDNFYIALYDPERNLIEFPYHVDQYDETPQPYPPGKGLTEYVMRTSKPLLASPEGLDALVEAGEVKRVGAASLDWLGVPLIVENQTIGVMAVQTYTEGIRFSQADLNVLNVVSTQIALVIYRKRIEEQLNSSEEMYRTLVEASPDIIIVTDLENNITFASAHLMDILINGSIEDVIGTNIIQWVHSSDTKDVLEALKRVHQGERVINAQFRLVPEHGREIEVEANANLLRNRKGEGTAVVTILRDVTERRRIEKSLQESERRYHGIFNGVHDAIFVESVDGKILDCNESALYMYGYTREQMLSKIVPDLLPPGVKPVLSTDIPPTTNEIELMNVRSNGEKFPIELSISEQEISGEKMLLVVVRDITERRQAEKVQVVISKVVQATTSTKNLDELYESIHHALGELMPADNFYIALYDPTTNLIEFPYLRDEYDQKPAPHPPGRGLTEYVIRTGKPLLASPEGLEALVQAKEVVRIGAPSLDWLGVPLIVENQTIGVMVVQTYTEGIRFSEADLNVLTVVSSQIALAIFRKRIEAKLHDSEEMYRTLVEASPDVILVADLFGNINFASPNAKSLLQIRSINGGCWTQT